MAIKFFNDFSLEKEIYKIIYNNDNFNDWLESNPNKDLGEFNKQIHTSITGLNNIPDKEQITQKSLDEYLSNFGIYKNEEIRKKVVRLMLKEYKPKELFKKDDTKSFDWTFFKHKEIEEGDEWTYKDVTIIRPRTWQLFTKIEEINMPVNIDIRRKYNYRDFYGEKGYNRYLTTYGIAFYFVNYKENKETEESKTLLFMVIPHQLNFELLPRIKYNSVLLHHTSYMDNIYVMGEEKPLKEEVEKFLKEYDLENILLPISIKGWFINRILNFKFKK